MVPLATILCAAFAAVEATSGMFCYIFHFHIMHIRNFFTSSIFSALLACKQRASLAFLMQNLFNTENSE